MTTLNLTQAELSDLHHLLSGAADLKQEQLNDIGHDEPFADPKERDEIRDHLQREVAVAHKVLALVHLAQGAAAPADVLPPDPELWHGSTAPPGIRDGMPDYAVNSAQGADD